MGSGLRQRKAKSARKQEKRDKRNEFDNFATFLLPEENVSKGISDNDKDRFLTMFNEFIDKITKAMEDVSSVKADNKLHEIKSALDLKDARKFADALAIKRSHPIIAFFERLFGMKTKSEKLYEDFLTEINKPAAPASADMQAANNTLA